MKLILQIILILVIVSTLCICAIKPEMHKSVLVYNSDYKLVPEEEVQVEKEEIPVMEMSVTPKTETLKKEIQTVAVPATQKVVQQTIQKPKTQTVAQNVVKTQPKTTVQTPVKYEVSTVAKPSEKKIVNEITKQEPKVIQTQTQTVLKVLTQKEEEIAWNVWRSNLQNQIMKDVKLPVLPNGIIFRFSFNVDKYGKITNIYTSSDNPAFTPYAIQYIAPVIRSYQGKSILNFPEGSSRVSTEFKGGWKISSSERLSTPQDYNDYEKITRITN